MPDRQVFREELVDQLVDFLATQVVPRPLDQEGVRTSNPAFLIASLSNSAWCAGTTGAASLWINSNGGESLLMEVIGLAVADFSLFW
jgi:hypothetical protein